MKQIKNIFVLLLLIVGLWSGHVIGNDPNIISSSNPTYENINAYHADNNVLVAHTQCDSVFFSMYVPYLQFMGECMNSIDENEEIEISLPSGGNIFVNKAAAIQTITAAPVVVYGIHKIIASLINGGNKNSNTNLQSSACANNNTQSLSGNSVYKNIHDDSSNSFSGNMDITDFLQFPQKYPSIVIRQLMKDGLPNDEWASKRSSFRRQLKRVTKRAVYALNSDTASQFLKQDNAFNFRSNTWGDDSVHNLCNQMLDFYKLEIASIVLEPSLNEQEKKRLLARAFLNFLRNIAPDQYISVLRDLGEHIPESGARNTLYGMYQYLTRHKVLYWLRPRYGILPNFCSFLFEDIVRGPEERIICKGLDSVQHQAMFDKLRKLDPDEREKLFKHLASNNIAKARNYVQNEDIRRKNKQRKMQEATRAAQQVAQNPESQTQQKTTSAPEQQQLVRTIEQKPILKKFEITVIEQAITFLHNNEYEKPEVFEFEGTRQQKEFHVKNMTMLHWHMNIMEHGVLEEQIMHAFGASAQSVAHIYNKSNRLSEVPTMLDDLHDDIPAWKLFLKFVDDNVCRFVHNSFSHQFLTEKIHAFSECGKDFAQLCMSVHSSEELLTTVMEKTITHITQTYNAAMELTVYEFTTLVVQTCADTVSMAIHVHGVVSTGKIVYNVGRKFPCFMGHVVGAVRSPGTYIEAFSKSVKTARDVIAQTPEYCKQAIEILKNLFSGPPQPLVFAGVPGLACEAIHDVGVLEEILTTAVTTAAKTAVNGVRAYEQALFMKQGFDKDKELKTLLQELEEKTELSNPAHDVIQYEKLKRALLEEQFTSITPTTKHGLQRLIERGFTPEEVFKCLYEPSIIKTQADGAHVFIVILEDNKYNAIVRGGEGVISAFRHVDQKTLNGLTKNYGWS